VRAPGNQQEEVIEYLVQENRTLRAQLSGRRLRSTDVQRNHLAVRSQRLGPPGGVVFA
jgi:hypothetical protein